MDSTADACYKGSATSLNTSKINSPIGFGVSMPSSPAPSIGLNDDLPQLLWKISARTRNAASCDLKLRELRDLRKSTETAIADNKKWEPKFADPGQQEKLTSLKSKEGEVQQQLHKYETSIKGYATSLSTVIATNLQTNANGPSIDVQAKLQRLTARLDTLEREISDLTNENKELKRRVQGHDSDLSSLKTFPNSFNQIKGEYGVVSEDLANLKKSCRTLEEKLSSDVAKKEDVRKLRTDLAESKNDFKKFKAEQKDVKGDNSTTQDKASEVEKDVAGKSKQGKEALVNGIATKSSIPSAGAVPKSKDDNIDSRVAKLSDGLRDLTTRVGASENQQTTQKNTVEELQKALDSLHLQVYGIGGPHSPNSQDSDDGEGILARVSGHKSWLDHLSKGFTTLQEAINDNNSKIERVDLQEGRLKALEENQPLLGGKIQAIESSHTTLAKRVTSLDQGFTGLQDIGERDAPKIEMIHSQEARVKKLEEGKASLSSSCNSLEKSVTTLFSIVRSQDSRRTSASASSDDQHGVSELSERVLNLEKETERILQGQTELDNFIGAENEELKKAVEERVDKARQVQANLEELSTTVASLSQTCQDIETKHDQQEKSTKDVLDKVLTLQAGHQKLAAQSPRLQNLAPAPQPPQPPVPQVPTSVIIELQRNVNGLQQQLDKTPQSQNVLNELQKKMDGLQQQLLNGPNPAPQIQHVMNELAVLHQRIDTNITAIQSLEQRYDNISTDDMAKRILNTLGQHFPFAPNALVEIRTMKREFSALREEVMNAALRSQQALAKAEDIPKDTERLRTLEPRLADLESEVQRVEDKVNQNAVDLTLAEANWGSGQADAVSVESVQGLIDKKIKPLIQKTDSMNDALHDFNSRVDKIEQNVKEVGESLEFQHNSISDTQAQVTHVFQFVGLDRRVPQEGKDKVRQEAKQRFSKTRVVHDDDSD